jgi:hypothetical protein
MRYNKRRGELPPPFIVCGEPGNICYPVQDLKNISTRCHLFRQFDTSPNRRVCSKIVQLAYKNAPWNMSKIREEEANEHSIMERDSPVERRDGV